MVDEYIPVTLNIDEDMKVSMSSDQKMTVGFGEVFGVSGSSAPVWLTNVSLPASAWTGSDKLWSQVVTIPATTEYSKVDLLPSAEQLAFFHKKDIAFTTENEDGVITVFAIGDKPTNDYTIQAVVTEVSA